MHKKVTKNSSPTQKLKFYAIRCAGKHAKQGLRGTGAIVFAQHCCPTSLGNSLMAATVIGNVAQQSRHFACALILQTLHAMPHRNVFQGEWRANYQQPVGDGIKHFAFGARANGYRRELNVMAAKFRCIIGGKGYYTALPTCVKQSLVHRLPTFAEKSKLVMFRKVDICSKFVNQRYRSGIHIQVVATGKHQSNLQLTKSDATFSIIVVMGMP